MEVSQELGMFHANIQIRLGYHGETTIRDDLNGMPDSAHAPQGSRTSDPE